MKGLEQECITCQFRDTWRSLNPKKHKYGNLLLLINVLHLLVALIFLIGILFPPNWLKYYLVLILLIRLGWIVLGECFLTRIALYLIESEEICRNTLKCHECPSKDTTKEQLKRKFLPLPTKFNYNISVILGLIAIIGIIEPNLSPFRLFRKSFEWFSRNFDI